MCPQLILDSQKRVFSWGFGGYGRLGHTEQKDEMVPRLVKLFDFPGRGAAHVFAGYQCSFALSEMGEENRVHSPHLRTYNMLSTVNIILLSLSSCVQGGCSSGGSRTRPESLPCTPSLSRTCVAGRSAASLAGE